MQNAPQKTNDQLPVRNLANTPLAQWSGDDCALYLSRKAVAYDWLERADKHCLARLQADAGAIPGYCLKNGNSPRTVTDMQKVFNRYAALGGTNESFIGAAEISLKALKALVNSLTGARGVALDKAVDAMIKDAHETKQNQP